MESQFDTAGCLGLERERYLSSKKVEKRAVSAERWGRADPFFILVLGFATVLSRVPFQTTLLSDHDAVNYALALGHFDMRLHQPQPPGYPLYILLGRAFKLVFDNPLTALVWVSMVFSGLAVIAIFLLGRAMYSRRVGAIAALLLATSSTFWFFGEIARPYTTDLFASAVVGWLCYRLLNSSEGAIVYVTGLGIGLAGAFRVQTMVFLFPLFLYALRHRPWRTMVVAILISGGVFGLFFVPAVMISGGPSAFILSMRVTIPIFWSKETALRSVRMARYVKNAETVLRYTLRVMGELVVSFALLGYITRPNWLKCWRNGKLRFLVIWVLPVWVIYLVIWPGNLGTIFVCLTPLFLLAALGFDWIIERFHRGNALGWGMLLLTLGWAVAIFALLPRQPFGAHYRFFDNRDTIESINEYYRSKLELVSDLPVEGTIVFANAFRHLQFYAPEYRVFSYPLLRRSDPNIVKSVVHTENGVLESWSGVETTALTPPHTERIVFFDLPRDLALVEPALIKEHKKNGHTVYVIVVPKENVARWTEDGLALEAYE